MVQFSSENEQSEIKRVLVLGALGAGKSTVLNVLNSEALKSDRKEFFASNQLTGCTQKFDYDISPFPFPVGQVQLIDSPGHSDPNLPIDQWVNLFNETIAQQQWRIDLVVCVIEYCQRPSTKESTLFALLNQALDAIKADNLVVLFNKAPDNCNAEDARAFYDQCCKNLRQQDCKLPLLTDENFLVLTRQDLIQRRMNVREIREAQKELIELLSKDICPFIFERLQEVQKAIKPKQADRKLIAESLLDESSKQEMAEQLKQYEAQKKHFIEQTEQKKKEFVAYKKQMDEQARIQELAMQSLELQMKSQAKDHEHAMELMKANFNARQTEMAAAHSQVIASLQAQMRQMQSQMQNQSNKKKVRWYKRIFRFL